VSAVRQAPRLHEEVSHLSYMFQGNGVKGRDTGYYKGELVKYRGTNAELKKSAEPMRKERMFRISSAINMETQR